MKLSKQMASGSNNAANTTEGLVTCMTCNHTVIQASGKGRTICPNCGNFYTKEAAELASTYQRNAGRGSSRQLSSRHGSGASNSHHHRNSSTSNSFNQNESSGNRSSQTNSVSNFLQNLTPRERRARNSDRESSNTDRDSLPPIDQGSRSQLTVPGNNRSPIYSPSPGSSSACGQNCIHHKHKHYSSHPKEENGSKNRLSPNTVDIDKNSNKDAKLAHGKSPGRENSSAKIIYPVRDKTAEQLKSDFLSAKESGNWKTILDFYILTFDSFHELNAAFKKEPMKEYKTTEDPGLKLDFIGLVFDILMKTPQGLQKEVLKCIINSLLKDKRSHNGRIWPHSKDDLRAFLILLQNPQFSNQTTYVIFAHLLRQIAALSDHDHHFLVHWLKKLKKDRFSAIVGRMQNFVSVRLFPPKPEDLPPLSKCSWWIPSSVKVLALFNAANGLTTPPIVQHKDFYNSTLDHLDLMAEYYAWQNPSSHAGFSFCQYPFILSIAAKRAILQKDSEQQMIIMARKSLVAKVQRRQLPDIGMLFLNLNVRRAHLVSDSLNEIASKQHDLKKKLKVTFTGEPGLDMGGLTKEWFLLLIRQIFQTNYGMFTYDKKAGVYWFSPNPCDNYQEFNLVGVLMGLAVYNSINLDVRFPAICYKKLLSPAVVPFNNPKATVGVCPATLLDLKDVQPEVAKGLQELLDYKEEVEDIFCLNFEVTTSMMGTTNSVPLKKDGENISVTNKNKKEYVQLYVEWLLNKSIYSQFQAFYHGFHSVCASNALIMLRPEEVETLVCGSPTLVMSDLKKVVVYDGYQAQDPPIKNFWDVVLHFPVEMQKKLLLFATGSDRIPIGGISEMSFKISRIDDLSLLPMSHTCFNQLVLPPYKSRKVMKDKLITAISNAEGFGLE